MSQAPKDKGKGNALALVSDAEICDIAHECMGKMDAATKRFHKWTKDTEKKEGESSSKALSPDQLDKILKDAREIHAHMERLIEQLRNKNKAEADGKAAEEGEEK